MRPYLHNIVLCVFIQTLLSGCGGPAAPDAAPAADSGPPADFAAAAAGVRVSERSDNMGSAYSTSITGSFYTGAPLLPMLYQERLREASCRQLTSEPGFCSEPCEGFCTGNGLCAPFPTELSVGPLTVSGLGAPLTIPAMPGIGYSYFADARLLTTGETVRVSAPGDALPALSLQAAAPEPLVVENLAELSLAAGRALTIRWIRGMDPGARIWLWLRADRGHAMLSPAVIECDVADTGSLTIPADWIDWIRDPDHWSCGDCFESTMARVVRTTATVDGTELELRLTSEVGLYLVPWSGL